MSECNGCGRCCDPVALPYAPIDIQTGRLEGIEHPRNVEWMKRDLEPMPRREGLAKADYMTNGGKTAGSATLTSAPQILFTFFYRCRNFDADTRTCRIYADRPPACSDFPWGRGGPDPTKSLPPECSYNADVGKPVKLMPTHTPHRA